MMKFAAILMMTMAGIIAQENDNAPPRFIEGLGDIPLIEDLSIIDEPYIFETSAGTIAKIHLEGSKKASFYMALYQESLAVFGWTCDDVSRASLQCRHEGDSLTISVLKGKGEGPMGELLEIELKPVKR